MFRKLFNTDPDVGVRRFLSVIIVLGHKANFFFKKKGGVSWDV